MKDSVDVEPSKKQLELRRRGDGRIYRRAGSSNLWCAYFLRGKEYRESTGSADPARAEKYLRHRLKEVGADQVGMGTFVGPQQDRLKMRAVLEALEDDYRLREKESPQFKTHLKHIRNYFDSWRAVEVSAAAVDRFIARMRELDYAPATINRSTQLLAQALKLAASRGHLSSVPQIRHLSEKGNARQGYFTDAEYRSLMNELPVYLRDFTEFGFLTGWRKGEVASLCWSDVEGDIVRLRGANSKNGEARIVTLNGALASLIDRRRADRQVESEAGVRLSAYIFHLQGEPVGDFRKAWATACVAAGLGHFSCESCRQIVNSRRCRDCKREARYVGRIFHDFRRTAIRNMTRRGVPDRVAMTISGHKTRAIFDRYNIVSEADIRQAIQGAQSQLHDAESQESEAAVLEMRPVPQPSQETDSLRTAIDKYEKPPRAASF